MITQLMTENTDRESHLLSALRRLTRALDQHSRALWQAHGLTVPQWTTLQALAQTGSRGIGGLAREVRLSQATLTGIVDRLSRQGFVERLRDPSDRRSVQVALTEAGRQLLSTAPSPWQDQFRLHLASLPSDEATSLVRSLEQVAGWLEQPTSRDLADVSEPGTEPPPSQDGFREG